MSWLLKVTHKLFYVDHQKGTDAFSFHRCHIMPGIANLVILGRILDGKKTLLARSIQRTAEGLGPYDARWVIIG